MAVYRQLQIGFWQDEFVNELTPEEKYFYIYIMTNSRTTQCGIYKFNMRLAEYETGCDRETIEKHLEKFAASGRILRSETTNEIMIVNWIKYNFINSKNTILCMNKELKEVKDKSFLEKLYNICRKKEYPVELIFNGIEIASIVSGTDSGNNEGSSLVGAYKPLGEEETGEETEIKEEAENYKAAEPAKAVEKQTGEKESAVKAIEAFNNNIHLITPMEFEKLSDWLESVEPGVVVLAIEEAVNNNARNMSYINTILSNWQDRGVTTEVAAQDYIRARRVRKNRDTEKDKTNNPGNSAEKTKRTNAAAYKLLGEEKDELGILQYRS